MKNLKEIFANNLITLRKQANITQFDLAQKLNYSDKAISKWERGEALPDIVTLKEIADLFDVTIDQLISDTTIDNTTLQMGTKKHASRLVISLFYSLIVWVVATFYYAIAKMITPDFPHAWKVFILAIPAYSLVLFIFSCIWGKIKLQALLLSLVLWTLALVLFLFISISNNWLFFILGIPLQISIILFYMLLKQKTHK